MLVRKRFLPWLKTSNSKDLIHLEETGILADNLSRHMCQVSAHAMIENESYEHIIGLFDVYLNYLSSAETHCQWTTV